MIWILLGLGWLVLAGALGIGIGRAVARRDRETIQAEAWEHGFAHAARTCHHAVAIFPKPYITMGEERGWEMAREQLRAMLARLCEES